MTTFAAALRTVERVQPMRVVGAVAGLRGLSLLVDDLPLPVGSLVSVGRGAHAGAAEDAVFGEIVGFTREQSIVMLLGQAAGIRAGDPVVGEQIAQTAPVGVRLLGRVIDGLGRPIDGKGPVHDTTPCEISPDPIPAMRRRRISEALRMGVRAIDLMTTVGRGQRLGIFAGPGVGKSTLLGSFARRTNADVCVIALVGERGREVKDFIEHSLGEDGLKRSVVVVATGDESPLLRLRAAKLACTTAEFFRDRGNDVLLMMDSITRFAHAQRQVGLSVGEPPATKGYTPSVFAQLSLLLERAGAVERRGDAGAPAGMGGSITGLYTILVEGDDLTEPVADAARGILDGHVILSRRLAQRAHYPAVDVLDSVSRVAEDVCDPEHVAARRTLSRLLAAYRDAEDLVQIGAYAKGSSPDADAAIEHIGAINALLRQERNESEPFEKSRAKLIQLAKAAEASIQKAAGSRAA